MRKIIEDDALALMTATGKTALTSLTMSLQDLEGNNVEAEEVVRKSKNAEEAEQSEEAEAEATINLGTLQKFTQTSASPQCVLLVRNDTITPRLDLRRSKLSPSPDPACKAKV